MVEEFHVAKYRVAMTFRDSGDNKVSAADIKTRSRRKCLPDASASLAQAEGNLKVKDIIGGPCMGKQGLGMSYFQRWGKVNPQERRTMVQVEIRDLEEE